MRSVHVVALLLGATACARAPSLRHHEVILRGGEFVPASLAVAVGDTVTWRNDDPVPHTVTGEAWDSGELAAGEEFTRAVGPGEAGSYACRYHPLMRGVLTVR